MTKWRDLFNYLPLKNRVDTYLNIEERNEKIETPKEDTLVYIEDLDIFELYEEWKRIVIPTQQDYEKKFWIKSR